MNTARLSKYEVKKKRERQSEIEVLLQKLEVQLGLIGSELENPPEQSDVVLVLGEQYVNLQDQIRALTAEWDEIENQVGE